MDSFGTAITLIHPILGVFVAVAHTKKKQRAAQLRMAPPIPSAAPTRAPTAAVADRQMLAAQIAGLIELRIVDLSTPETEPSERQLWMPAEIRADVVQATVQSMDSEYSHLFGNSNVDRSSQVAKPHWQSAL